MPLIPSVTETAQVTFAAADPAGRVLNAQPGLRNIERMGVLVDQIAFRSDQGGSTGMLVELKWRDMPITNGFVPLGAVGYPQNRRMEVGAGAGATSVIRLSKPIYLPPSEYISVAVQNSLVNGGAGLTNVNVAYLGRLVEAEPPEKWLPYVSAYLGPAVTDNNAAALSSQSNPNDMQNPFDVPMLVERLVGRVLVAAAAAGPYRDAEPAPVWNTYLLRLSDHRDRFWTPFPVPFSLVFNSVDRSWILNREMEPKGFLRAEFEGTANVVGAGFSRVAVGIVGYRRIA